MFARLCAWLFQHPRLEHGFFIRTTDFLQITDEMGIDTPPSKIIRSIIGGFDGEDSASERAQADGRNEQHDNLHNGCSAHYVQAQASRYLELNHRLRHAAWRS